MATPNSSFCTYFQNVHGDAELRECTFLDNLYSAEGIRFKICLVHYGCFFCMNLAF